MWRDEPSAAEIASWFAGAKLHPKMEHDRYVGGIVAIENRQTKQWNPFPLAAVRVAYFWDWIDANGYTAVIDTTPPTVLDLPFKKGEAEGEKYATAAALYVEAKITVYNEGGAIVRRSAARKSVSCGMNRNTYSGGRKTGSVKLPDFDSLMKAETGAVARACAMLGMLALPGSGIASAEDIHEFLRQEDVDTAEAAAAEDGAGKAPEPASGGRAPSPKRGRQRDGDT
jgi:hypothetical protein